MHRQEEDDGKQNKSNQKVEDVMQEHTKLYCDGASRGNPGPSSIAVIISNDGRFTIIGGCLKKKHTNNEAEYLAIKYAINHAISNGLKTFEIVSDSKLAISQLSGKWTIRTHSIMNLHCSIRDMCTIAKAQGRLEKIILTWEPRTHPQIIEADAVCNKFLNDRKPILEEV
jgi:ribonuclease HI